MEQRTCETCGDKARFSAPVSVILVFMPLLPKPFPLVAAADYPVCRNCNDAANVVDVAVSKHSRTRNAGMWTRAVLLFQDGLGCEVCRRPKNMAQA